MQANIVYLHTERAAGDLLVHIDQLHYYYYTNIQSVPVSLVLRFSMTMSWVRPPQNAH